MAGPYPLAPDNFEKACKGVKLEPDKTLLKALEEYFNINKDQPEKRLAMLPKLAKLATEFKKSKTVVAAGAKAAAVVDDLINYLPTERKEREKDAAGLQRNAAREVGVMFKIRDWNGKSFDSAPAFVTFEAPDVPTINKNGRATSAGYKIDRLKLAPEGLVALLIETPNGDIEGSATYKLKPSDKNLSLEAEQHSKPYKTTAKSLDEVKKKYGWKGTVGVEFKVVSVGGEKTSESEYNQAREEAVEWSLEAGVPTFKIFKQI